ncbi:MAG: hypothetical protein L0220_02460 [Acidobacteria bacterium]|nr:hypothetical protein [Acidobacteriota bacterium]
MKITTIIFCGILLAACAAPGQGTANTPQAQQYPPVIADSDARQQAAQDGWKSFLEQSGLSGVKIELEPLLNTPRGLPPEAQGRIKISRKSGPFGEIEAKEVLRGFIESHRGLLSGDPKSTALNLKDISLVSLTIDQRYYQATYKQVSYPFPITDDYGELLLAVSKDGILHQCRSTLIPTLDLPSIPEVKAEELKSRLINREFSYTNIAGIKQSYRITRPEEIVVRDLVVYLKRESRKISVHLAYPVEAGSGMLWTVYFDAINGQELGVKQNFVS